MSSSLMFVALVFAAFFYVVLPLGRLTTGWRLMVFAGLLVLGFVPYNGLELAGYLGGVIGGDLAIPSLVLLVWGCLRQTLGQPAPELMQRMVPLFFFAALGLVLYPATLGLSSLDPYRFGFEPGLLLVISGAAALAFCFLGNCVASVALILAGLAFMLDLKDTRNYWDYLIDPALFLYSLSMTLRWLGRIAWARVGSVRKPALAVGEA